MRLLPVRLGLSFGIIWGISMLFLAFFSTKEYGLSLFKPIAEVYICCSQKNLFYKLMCGVMGFLDGFCGGFLIALIYNNLNINY